MVVTKMNGTVVPTGPTNWKDINVLASFNDEEVSATVDLDELIFSGEEFELIDSWKKNGINGYQGLLQGMPYNFELNDFGQSKQVFDGYLDFKTKYRKFDGCSVATTAASKDDTLTLNEQLQSINYGLLQDQGIFKSSDVEQMPYVVDKYESGAEFALLSITIFLTLKETIESAVALGESTADAIKAATPNIGIPPSVDTGDIIAAIFLVIVRAAYTALMISYLINLGKEVIDFIYPPIRFNQGAFFSTYLERAAEKLGYKFQSSITELYDTLYLPSQPDEESESLGIPRPEDIGYNCNEMFGVCKRLFNAKVAIDGDTIVMNSDNDAYWLKQSEYTYPDVLDDVEEYNLDEVIGNKLLSFGTDPVGDEWTAVDYRGTSYAIHTVPKNNDGQDLITGFERVDFSVCLGSRKNELTDLEKAIKACAQALDKVINTIGGKSNLAAKIENRIGLLRKSSRTHSKPKAMRVSGTGKTRKLLPRDEFSAKYLYEKYHIYNSFVLGNYNAQKQMFPEREITFCLSDFLKTIKNSYFTIDGKDAKFTRIDWNFSSDTATASYWIRKPYTKNLTEEYAEAA